MIIVKYPAYNDKNVEMNHLLRQDINSKIIVDRVIRNYENEIPKINTIEIETINRCNNDCSFCPVNKNADTRSYKKMDTDFFYSLINQLSDMNYTGHLSLFSNNEPLIDVRIYEFLEYSYKKVPNATHILYTNGTLLNEEKFLDITKYLDYLVIDNYDDDLKLLPNIEIIVDKHKNDISKCKTSVLIRKKNQVLSSRGGTAPNRDITNLKFDSGCILPFMQMVIRPDGKVSKCCQDALGLSTIGDLNNMSILELWESKAYDDFRRKICQGRGSIEMCSKCDLFGMTNYFPESWITKTIQALVDITWNKKEKENKKIYVYNKTKTSKKISKLLNIHGLSSCTTLLESELDNIDMNESFIIFPSYDYRILEQIDPKCELIGKLYMIYEDVTNSLHTEFIEEEFNSELDNLVNFLTAINTKKVIVFGTGFSATKICRMFKIKPYYYIDNNEARWNTELDGIKIYPPIKLKEEKSEDMAVIIGSLKYKDMYEQLVNEEICSDKVIWDGLQFSDFI